MTIEQAKAYLGASWVLHPDYQPLPHHSNYARQCSPHVHAGAPSSEATALVCRRGRAGEAEVEADSWEGGGVNLSPVELAAIIALAFAAGAWWAFPMAKRWEKLRLMRELDHLEEDVW
jgi:hypothetical protein